MKNLPKKIKNLFCSIQKKMVFENSFDKLHLPIANIESRINLLSNSLEIDPANEFLKGEYRLGCAIEREMRYIEKSDKEFPSHISNYLQNNSFIVQSIIPPHIQLRIAKPKCKFFFDIIFMEKFFKSNLRQNEIIKVEKGTKKIDEVEDYLKELDRQDIPRPALFTKDQFNTYIMDRILDQEDPIGLMNEKDNFPFTIVLSRIGTNKRMVFRCVKDNSEIQFLTSDIVDWETEFFIPKLRSFKKLNFDEMRIMESNFANLNEPLQNNLYALLKELGLNTTLIHYCEIMAHYLNDRFYEMWLLSVCKNFLGKKFMNEKEKISEKFN